MMRYSSVQLKKLTLKQLFIIIVLSIPLSATFATLSSTAVAQVVEYYPNGTIVTPIPLNHVSRKLYSYELSRNRHIKWDKNAIVEQATKAARYHGIPSKLFIALIKQESSFNINAVSAKGAIGLTQLMPDTARSLGVNPNIPMQNIDGGARYLASQYRKFKAWNLALAAYNAGPEAVEKYKGVPPYEETQHYVSAILTSWKKVLKPHEGVFVLRGEKSYFKRFSN